MKVGRQSLECNLFWKDDRGKVRCCQRCANGPRKIMGAVFDVASSYAPFKLSCRRLGLVMRGGGTLPQLTVAELPEMDNVPNPIGYRRS